MPPLLHVYLDYGVTVNVALAVLPPWLAMIVPVVVVATVVVVMPKVQDACCGGMYIDAGTMMLLLFDVRRTVRPLGPAFPFMLTLAVTPVPPVVDDT